MDVRTPFKLSERVFCGIEVLEKWLQIGLFPLSLPSDACAWISPFPRWMDNEVVPFIRPSIGSSMVSPAHLRVGLAGEALAAKFLQSEGYIILGKNVRMGRDEVDIIVFDPKDDAIVFVEVKTRTTKKEDFPAAMAAGRLKRANMLRAARRWAADREYEGGYRLDVISVEGGRVTGHLIEVNGA